MESANSCTELPDALAATAPLPAERSPRIRAAWLVVPFLACDFLMTPVLSSLNGPAYAIRIAIGLGIVGCVFAQGNLLAAWLAWSDGPFLRRLATHWIVATGLYLVWLVGFGLVTLAGNRIPPVIAATVALGLPLVSLAVQFPLWVARQWFGWRLVRVTTDSPPSSEQRLSIRDLMLATVLVAVSLALARLAPSPDAGGMWPVWAFVFVVASVVSTIALLPAGALLMRPRLLSRALAQGGLYAGAWIALVWVVVAILRWYGVRLPPWELFVGLTSLMTTFAATLMLTGTIAKGRGYRLK
jgi:hypothetical protein